MSSQFSGAPSSASDFGSKHINSTEKDPNEDLMSQDPFADKESKEFGHEAIPPQDGLPADVEIPQQHQPEVADVPPNGGYGWVIVLCNALINAHTWGLNSVSFPAF